MFIHYVDIFPSHLNISLITSFITFLFSHSNLFSLNLQGDHVHNKNRFRVQSTMKMNCPASVYIREVCRFPDFKVRYNFICMQRFESGDRMLPVMRGTLTTANARSM